MTILWTLLAAAVRAWAWAVRRSADRWVAVYEAEQTACEQTAAKSVNGDRERIGRDRLVGRLMDRADRAEAKVEGKIRTVERLDRFHAWLSRPRTLAGWLAGATALPATAGVAHLFGADVPAALIHAAEWLKTVGG